MVNRKLFRPTLTEVKDQFAAPRPVQAMPQQVPSRKKPAPPEQTPSVSTTPRIFIS
jgi:hypothetical protein